MRPSTRASRILALGLLTLALVGAVPGPVSADPTRTLVPIGSDYQPDTLQLFAKEAAHRSRTARSTSSCIPITYSLSADGTDEERAQEEPHPRRQSPGPGRGCVQRRARPARPASCSSSRSSSADDAVAFDPAPYFDPDLDGMFVLGGDQTVGMNTVHGTPLEAAMAAAFQAGAASVATAPATPSSRGT